MAATKKTTKKAAKKNAAKSHRTKAPGEKDMSNRDSRCWPGYEPVPGKPENEQGSCRPKAESKLKPNEERVRAARKRQLATQKRKSAKKSA